MIEIIVAAAKAAGVSPALLFGICMAESSLRPDAIGDNGKSIGLCQVQIDTAKYIDRRFTDKTGCGHNLGFSKQCLLDPKINAQVAAKYLKYQMKRYGENCKKIKKDKGKRYADYLKCVRKNTRCAISAYNAERCIKSNQKSYVDKVLKYAKEKRFLNE